MIQGRRYHAFREGEYPLPDDEQEQDRLDLLHHLHLLVLDGNLYLAPIRKDVQRVLDVGMYRDRCKPIPGTIPEIQNLLTRRALQVYGPLMYLIFLPYFLVPGDDFNFTSLPMNILLQR